MRALVDVQEWADRNPVAREVRNAAVDGAYWGWLVTLIAAVAVWTARGLPDPRSFLAAALLIPVGAAVAGWRTWRRAQGAAPVDRRAAAAITTRRWLTGYGLAAALIPAAVLASQRPVAAVVVAVVVVLALAEVAIVTIPMRARARLLARLRIGARAVAGDEAVDVGRALWRRTRLRRVVVTYPPGWGVHRDTRRDELVERIVWELCGPPPRTPGEAIARPAYSTQFDHVDCRLIVERVPGLPRLLPARDFGQGDGAMVLGQTHAADADAVYEGVPVALYRPRNHALIVGGTQHGKSSGVRAWVTDGLTHGVWPGGVWCIDGKGSGAMAALTGRRGVHAVAHTPEEWRHVLVELVAPVVARRYAEMLDWRAGRSTTRPDHPLALLSLDEIQQVLLSCPDLAPVLDTLARQALEAGVILWVITQRPDAKDAVPGAMRDQLLDRVTFGPLSGSGAKMAFDIAGDWHKALGIAPIAGRALVWLDGVWRHVQAPWLPLPADVPQVEELYPPRDAQRSSERARDRTRDHAEDPAPQPPPERPHDPAPGPAEQAAGDTAQGAAAGPFEGYGPPPPPHPEWDGRPSAPWPPRPPEPPEDDDPAYDPSTARRRRRRPPAP